MVDDNPEFLEAARRLLDREGIDVVGVATTVDEAFLIANERRPDVTLLDIDLGPEDGIDVARRLAEIEGQPAGKVILISTHAEDDLRDAIASSTAVGFLSKSSLSASAIQGILHEAAR